MLEPPRRPSRRRAVAAPADPNRTQQNLTFGLDLLGGFDDNLPPEQDGASEFVPRSPVVTWGLSVARMNYGVGEVNERSFDMSGRSYMNHVPQYWVYAQLRRRNHHDGRTALGQRGRGRN